jgi:hypothetical protein
VSNKKASRETSILVCPRCGLKIDYVSEEPRGSRTYFYAVHVSKIGKKRRVKKCYLGPADKYQHAERLVQLDLTNVLDLDFLRVVERAVENFINAARSANSKELQKYLEKSNELRARLEKLILRVVALREELEEVVKLEQGHR